LMARGLTEDEAVELIIEGLLVWCIIHIIWAAAV